MKNIILMDIHRTSGVEVKPKMTTIVIMNQSAKKSRMEMKEFQLMEEMKGSQKGIPNCILKSVKPNINLVHEVLIYWTLSLSNYFFTV